MFVLRLSVTFLSYSQGSDSTFAVFMHIKIYQENNENIDFSHLESWLQPSTCVKNCFKDINEMDLKAFTTFKISMFRKYILKMSQSGTRSSSPAFVILSEIFFENSSAKSNDKI